MNNGQNQKGNVIMNETKGRGLFYGVIAIATFIVMAVGATFAYFTATTESMNAAVQTGSTTLQLKYISYGSAWSNTELIPADTAVVEYSVEQQNDTTKAVADESGIYPKNAKNSLCKDDYGNSICSIYVYQVENTANSPQDVTLNVISEVNGFASLHAMAYEISVPDETLALEAFTAYNSKENGNQVNDPVFKKGDGSDPEDAIEVKSGDGTPLTNYNAVYINRKGTVKTLLKYKNPSTQAIEPALDRKLIFIERDKAGVDISGLTVDDKTTRVADEVEIEGGATKTFALVLYIKNENKDQTESDAEKTFSGSVVVKSGDGTSGVSGTITVENGKIEDQLQSTQKDLTEENQDDPNLDEGA